AGKFHITAHRQPAEFPARSPAIRIADDLPPEADREGVGLYAAHPANRIMAEFMDEDQWPDHQQKTQDSEQDAGLTCHAARAFMVERVIARASASIAKTASMSVGAA